MDNPLTLRLPRKLFAVSELQSYVWGLLLIGALALLATRLSALGWLQKQGISALTVAIVLGMLVGNTVYPKLAALTGHGVQFGKQKLLRLGIILYGLRLTFQDIAAVGPGGVVIDLTMVCLTFWLACWAGRRLFGLDRNTCMLIGAGSSICGAAAVMAADPVIRGRPEQTAVAISTVVVFGTLAIFLYPLLYQLLAHSALLALSPKAYGIFAGSTIHEVAQVVAAGRSVSEPAADAAVITKMVRVMMLAPFLFLLSAYLSRHAGPHEHSDDAAPRIVVPWFAFVFVAVAAFNSLNLVPKSLATDATLLDTVLLAMAMAALGLTTQASAIIKAGVKPLGLAGLLFLWLIIGGFAINLAVTAVCAKLH